MKTPSQLQAFKYTSILENGIIKVPEFKNYKKQEVEVFIIFKSQNKEIQKKKSINDFLTKWQGVFSEVQTDDVKYNYLMNKHK